MRQISTGMALIRVILWLSRLKWAPLCVVSRLRRTKKRVYGGDVYAAYYAIGSSLTQFDCDLDGSVTLDDDTIVYSTENIAADGLPGDANGDWVVDAMDVDLVSAAFGTNWMQATSMVMAKWVRDCVKCWWLWATTMVTLDGDINNDCSSIRMMGPSPPSWAQAGPADSNGDGMISSADTLFILSNAGSSCNFSPTEPRPQSRWRGFLFLLCLQWKRTLG